MTFEYTIDDGTDEVEASAFLQIDSINDAPTTTPVVLIPIAEDSGIRVITQADLLANASDIDGDSLTANGLSITSGNGTLVDNGDGTWNYTPATDDDTDVSFSYNVSDGTLSAPGSATLDITPVNDAPAAVNDAFTTNEDTPYTATLNVNDLLQNDSDLDGDTLSVNTTPVSGPTSGTLVLNADGTFTYTPGANFNGTDSFVYEVNDGNGATAQATVDITVNSVNDAPTTTQVRLSRIDEDSGARLITQAQLLKNANDIDGDTLTARGLTIAEGRGGTLIDNLDGT